MNNIVSVAVHDESVNIEGDVVDQMPTDVLKILVVFLFLALELPEAADHVFYHAHCVFVEGKGKEVLDGVVEVGEGVLEGEGFDDFLDEVGGVVVAAQFIILRSYLKKNQMIFFRKLELRQKCLDCMRSLFIPHQLTQIWHYCLQYLQSLC